MGYDLDNDLNNDWNAAMMTSPIHHALEQFWDRVDNDKLSSLSAVDNIIKATKDAPDEYLPNIHEIMDILTQSYHSFAGEPSDYQDALSERLTGLRNALSEQSMQNIQANDKVLAFKLPSHSL